MTVIPADRLCLADLRALGNNLVGALSPGARRRTRRRGRCDGRRTLDAVNRSLAAAAGERVAGLHAPASAGPTRVAC